MLNCKQFYEYLNELGVDFFSGVPDSLLKEFCAYLEKNCEDQHIISANESV